MRAIEIRSVVRRYGTRSTIGVFTGGNPIGERREQNVFVARNSNPDGNLDRQRLGERQA
jgi:hypothetical protein